MLIRTKNILLLSLVIFCCGHLMAQIAKIENKQQVTTTSNMEEARELIIGDKVPDLKFKNVLFYTTKSAKLSDFNGNLIILDFWSSWCGNCISLFPHMDSLQKEFGNQLKIILVNTQSKLAHDDDSKIMRIIEGVKKRTGKRINLPVIYDCTELDTYFPCKYLPHEVWLGRDGKVLNITSSIEVNKDNIQRLLNNEEVQLHTKKDNFFYNSDKPLFLNGNGGNGDDFGYRSIFTGYKEGLLGETIRASPKDANMVIGFSAFNISLLGLLHIAYFGTGLLEYPSNRTIIEVSNMEPFKPHLDTSMYRYSYCYDITVPPVSDKIFRMYMQQDIARFFNISVKQEKRKLNCLILSATEKIKKSVSKSEKTEVEVEENTVHKYLHCYSLSELIKFFDLRLNKPLINETKLSENTKLDINLPFDLKDSGALIEALKKAGFSLKEELREVDASVITDK